MEDLGGYPALEQGPGGKWEENKFDLESLLIRSKKETVYIPILDIGVSQDDKNPSKYIAYVSFRFVSSILYKKF